MEHYMRDHLTEEIIDKAMKLYDIEANTIHFLGGFENFVFEYVKHGISYILRFVHSNHRPYEHVLAELEFIDYLHEKGASVSNVVHSIHDHIVEQVDIDDTQYFTIAVFDKAPGSYVKPEDITPEFWRSFGVEVGRMHRLTKDFKPKHKRPHWYEENFMDIAKRSLEEDDMDILEMFEQITTEIKSLPVTSDNYGLIHTDLHFNNLYYDNGRFTFFDFDDSAYKHFLSDIAIILYYYHMQKRKKIVTTKDMEYYQSVRDILGWFLSGYETEYHLDRTFFRYLNVFLSLRSVVLYVVLVAAGYKHHDDERYRNFCVEAKMRALHRLMEVDLDFVLKGL